MPYLHICELNPRQLSSLLRSSDRPPFNILALVLLLPLKLVVSPRWFHKINVTAVRTLNAPILLIISFIERRTLWSGTGRESEAEQLPKSNDHSKPGLWDFSRGFSVHGDISAVFDFEPPETIENEIAQDDDIGHHVLESAFGRELGAESSNRPGLKRVDTNRSRRDSVNPFVGLSQRLKDFLVDGSDDGEDGNNMKSRLEALEQSTGRIERLLGRLVADLDGTEDRSSNTGGYTGRMEDLDRSGTADIDD